MNSMSIDESSMEEANFGTEEANTNTSATSTDRRRRFEGKVAIITESNCGIDRATAILFGKEGAKVTIQGTEEAELHRTVVQMVRMADVSQDDILVVEGAIDNDQTLKNLVERTYNKFGQIDVLVNNAGSILQHQRSRQNSNSTSSSSNNYGYDYTNGQNGAEEEDGGRGRTSSSATAMTSRRTCSIFGALDNDFDFLFNINLKSIAKLTRLCAPYLEETKGAVVNISSFGTQRSLSDYTYYSTIKNALDNYCRSIAVKFAKRDIRVNNINPGFIIGETLDEDDNRANKFELNWIKNHVPMGRGGTAEEIGKVVAFLASDDASYITGATITVDGAVSISSKPTDFF
ncbi:hypothetical protein niasHT_005348 [Heterodera trifolii]|uniref:Uncharacterized protein n=1 Tax=Heterodera trifolii TaxID=157864 RepID=A0ABD2M0Q2_9BILA